MTFARVNPSGWALGAKLSSAQQNQLDIDHANAIDKTGDNSGTTPSGGVTGEIEWLSGSSIVMDSGSSITANSGSTFTANSGSIVTFHNTPTFASGTIISGGNLTVDSDVNLYVLSGGNILTESGSNVFISVGSNGIISSVGGSGNGIVSMNDPLKYELTNSYARNVFQPFIQPAGFHASGGGTFTAYQYTGGLVGGGVGAQLSVPMDKLHDGATLSTITLVFAWGASFTAPTGFNRAALLLTRNTVDGTAGPSDNFGETTIAGSFFDASSYTSTNQQTQAFTVSSNNLIDVSKYQYTLTIIDVTASVTGNIYFGAVLGYTNITSLRFP